MLISLLTTFLALSFVPNNVLAQRGTDFAPMSRFYAVSTDPSKEIPFWQVGVFVNKTTGLLQIGGPATAYPYLFTKVGKTLQYPNPYNASDYQVVYAFEKNIRQLGLSMPHLSKVPAGASFDKFSIVNGNLTVNWVNTFAACPAENDYTKNVVFVGKAHKAGKACFPIVLKENVCVEVVDIAPAGSGGQLACQYD